jgi:UDP-glucuronate 4-epimerase
MPMQIGDVQATWADSTFLKNLTGYSPKTNFKEGIAHFVKWYKEHYKI